MGGRTARPSSTSAMPYDVTQQNFGDQGYAGYVIGTQVKTHMLMGAGVYSYFRDHEVNAQCGFRAPEGESGINLEHIFTVFLNGKGSIDHVLNQQGDRASPSTQGKPLYFC